MLHLFHLDNLGLLEDLDGIKAEVVPRLDEVYSTETSSTQGPQNVEIA